MLQKLHERMQGIIAGAIVVIICLTFALWGIQNYLHGGSARNEVAKIDGVKITQEKLRLAYERVRNQMLRQNPDFLQNQSLQAELKKQVLQQLVDNQVITNMADKLDFYVGYQELNAFLMSMPEFKQNGVFSLDRFQEVLRNMMYSETEFLDNLRTTVVTNQLRTGIIETNFILPNELAKTQQLLNEKRDIGYFLIPVNRFLSGINISSQQISDYYASHKQDFMTEETVSIDYVELLADKITAKIPKPTDEILQEYYRDNIDLYSSPKKWRLLKVNFVAKDANNAKEIMAGTKQLDTLKNILDETTLKTLASPLKGEVVTLAHLEMSPDLAEVVDKLAVNQTSDPFVGKEGLQMVKVIQILPGDALPFTQVRDKVAVAWQKQKAMEAFADASNKLADLTYTHSDSLTEAAKELDLSVQSSEQFSKTGAKDGIAANPKIYKMAYSDQVLQQSYNSNPIEIAPGNIVVLRIKKHIPSEAKPLAEVKNIIETRLKIAAAQNKAHELADQVLTAIKGGDEFSDIARKNNLSWQEMLGISRNDKTFDKTVSADVSDKKIISKLAFDLPAPADKHKPATMSKLNDYSYVVVAALKSVYPAAVTADNKESAALSEALQASFGQYEYQLFLGNWKAKSKIKIYEQDASINTAE